jgi:RNA polymerase sigma-70 factor
MSDALPLSSLLVARLGGQPSIALEDALQALFRAGQQAWPTVPLPAKDFVAHLAERLAARPPGPEESGPSLDKINGSELYLTCACAHGLPQALAAFESAYLTRVPAQVAHINRSPAFADEVCQVLRVNLLMGSDGKRPRIGEYAGRGALQSWLRIAAVRVALRLSRKRVVDGQDLDGPDGVAAVVEPALGPELAHIKARYQTEYKKAVEEAVLGLSSKQRNLLRLHFRAGLTGDQIAALFKVTRSTIMRWLSAARSEVLAVTQRLLQQRLQLSPEEFQSLARVVISQLDLSLSRVLREDGEE